MDGGRNWEKLCRNFDHFWSPRSFKSFGSFESCIYKTLKSKNWFAASKIAFRLD